MKPTIDVCDDVTLIILQNIPANMGFVTEVFEKIAAMDIDVDMISLAPPKSSQTSLSFTVSDDDLVKILGYTSKLNDGSIKPIVSSGNYTTITAGDGDNTIYGSSNNSIVAGASPESEAKISALPPSTRWRCVAKQIGRAHV